MLEPSLLVVYERDSLKAAATAMPLTGFRLRMAVTAPPAWGYKPVERHFVGPVESVSEPSSLWPSGATARVPLDRQNDATECGRAVASGSVWSAGAVSLQPPASSTA